MGEIISLNKVRKEKARERRAADAAENRVRFGRTKAEKAKVAAETEREAHRLDGHRRGEDET